VEVATKYNIVLEKSQEFDLNKVRSYLRFVRDFLGFKLSRIRVLGVQNESGDVKFFKLPVRGTKLYYRFYTKRRFKQIKRSLSGLIRVEGNRTNAIFLTLTYDCKVDLNSLASLWSVANKEASYFINRLKKRFKRLGCDFEYIRVVEAHRLLDDNLQINGKPHFHYILVFNRFFRFHRKGGKFWFSNRREYQELLKIVQKTWGYGFVSLVPVASGSGAVGYVAKYVSKSAYLENLNLSFSEFENFGFLEDRESEIKKMILFYHLLKFHLRFFAVSRGITKLDKQHINNSDNFQGEKWVLYRGGYPIWLIKLFRMGAISVIFRGLLNSG